MLFGECVLSNSIATTYQSPESGVEEAPDELGY